ncbi:hypothetical protein RXV86_05610 [Alisedimentitalea sp. MJ-SS2]|uniref:hypothetical protein n=1 Tax=Aliisedimentitalea sp. MJ-SS2 TaxID=3049795 RepID=UPI002908C164|nr:hypothetical protein [Alisedimentitalea sp. MJ-SS2]MDU8926852.1 hypothetical protein [Alisedimentitalea sp. MJ-SS2]
MKTICYAALLSCSFGAQAAQADSINGFDPSKPCVQILSNTGGTTDQFMIAAWVFGYLASQNGAIRPVTIENNKIILKNLTEACIERSDKSLLDLVKISRAGADQGKGTEADARAMLEEFLKPGNDLARMTRNLLPRSELVRQVYGEPLATRMMEMYDAALTPDVKIAPKLGQTDLLMTYATTGALKQGAPELGEFPGGYKKVLPFIKADVPIVRFKFVKPGETLGMAYDGLVYVGGQWVWMPKPWRALED